MRAVVGNTWFGFEMFLCGWEKPEYPEAAAWRCR